MRIFNQYKGLRKEQYVIFVCKLIDNLGSMIGPMMTLILSTKLGMNASEIAMYTIMVTVLSLPIVLFGGKITDRFNKKLIINIFDISTSIIYIVCGIFGLSKVTLVFYIVGSLFQVAESPAYDSLVADFSTSEDRDKAYSLNYLGLNLGMMLAPTIGGLLLNNHLSLMFIINGTFQIASIIVFDIFIKDTRPIIDTSNKYEAKEENRISSLQVLMKNKIVIIFMIIFSFSITCYNMWGYLMPLSLTSVQGVNGSVFYGTMSSLNCVVVVLCTTPLTALLTKTTSINRMMLGNTLEISGFIIFLLFINKPFMYYVAIIIFTIGEITNTITTGPHLTKRIPMNYRGRIMSILYFMESVVYSLCSVFIGKVYDYKGLNVAWILVIVIGITTIIAYQLTKKKDKETYPDLYEKGI